MLVSLSLSTATARRKTKKKATNKTVRVSSETFKKMGKSEQTRYLKTYPKSSHRYLISDGEEIAKSAKSPESKSKTSGPKSSVRRRKTTTSTISKEDRHFKRRISRQEFDSLELDRQVRYNKEHGGKFTTKHLTQRKPNITSKYTRGNVSITGEESQLKLEKELNAYDRKALASFRMKMKQELKHGVTASSVRAAGKVTQEDIDKTHANLVRNKEETIDKVMDIMDEESSYTPILPDEYKKLVNNLKVILKDPESDFSDEEKKQAKSLVKKIQAGLNQFTFAEFDVLQKIRGVTGPKHEDPAIENDEEDGVEYGSTDNIKGPNSPHSVFSKKIKAMEEDGEKFKPSEKRRLRRIQERLKTVDPSKPLEAFDSSSDYELYLRVTHYEDMDDLEDSNPRFISDRVNAFREEKRKQQVGYTKKTFSQKAKEDIKSWEKQAFWRRDLAALKKAYHGEDIDPSGRNNVMVLGSILAKYALAATAVGFLAMGAAPAAIHVARYVIESWDSFNVDTRALAGASANMSDRDTVSLFLDQVSEQLIHLNIDEFKEDIGEQFSAIASGAGRIAYKCLPEERMLPYSQKTHWNVYLDNDSIGRISVTPDASGGNPTIASWLAVIYENGFDTMAYPHYDADDDDILTETLPYVLVDEDIDSENDLELHNPVALTLKDAQKWITSVIKR